MEKRNRKHYIGAFLIFVLALLFVVVSCYYIKIKSSPREEIAELVHTYLETCIECGYGVESSKYMHFEDDFKKQAYIDSGNYLYEYQILNMRGINNNLYEIELLVKSETSKQYYGNQFEHVWNFVCRINGKWYYLNGISHIPHDLREGLDESRYKINDPLVVPDADIIQSPVIGDGSK